MKSIKLSSLDFDDKGFRKLSKLEIPISRRITIIAGHNGIGKSSILGLIANCSAGKKHESYFDKSFKAEFQELFYLDIANDVKEPSERGNVFINYNITHDSGEEENFTKRCTVGANSKWDKELGDYVPARPRVIPRSTDSSRSKELGLSVDGKMPIPTIYLGMSRMTPIGEIDEETIEKTTIRSMADEDKDFLEKAFQTVMDYTKSTEKDCIVGHNFKGTKKRSKLPNMDYNTLAISLGQDSLSSIVTALVSFQKIKREMGGDYIGGILVIDEIEAGLHPRAQLKLMELLKREANKLKLQIILTSHSLTIIKFILDLQNPLANEFYDSVVYLTDTRLPKVTQNPTYLRIKHDMLLVNDSLRQGGISAPVVKVYFEDDEAKYFFEKILQYLNFTNAEMSFGANIEPISLKVGSEILIKLIESDDYFKRAVLIADNDVASKQTNRNVIDANENFCVLPQSNEINQNSPSQDRNPEALIYSFIESKYINYKENREFWNSSDFYTTDYVHEHILIKNLSERKDRVVMKAWFKSCKNYFEEQKILEHWCSENSNHVDDFIEKFTKAVSFAVENANMSTNQ